MPHPISMTEWNDFASCLFYCTFMTFNKRERNVTKTHILSNILMRIQDIPVWPLAQRTLTIVRDWTWSTYMSNMKSLFGTIKKLQPGHDLLRTDRLITVGHLPLCGGALINASTSRQLLYILVINNLLIGWI
jgi:hypothetical protein